MLPEIYRAANSSVINCLKLSYTLYKKSLIIRNSFQTCYRNLTSINCMDDGAITFSKANILLIP